jgi:hypothetical protein
MFEVFFVPTSLVPKKQRGQESPKEKKNILRFR